MSKALPMSPGQYRAMEGELEMKFIKDSGELAESADEWTLHLMSKGYQRKEITKFLKILQ